MEPTAIMLIFRVPSLAKALAGYLELVETTDKKLEKLLSSDFNSGIRLLREISITTSRQHEFLMREAWKRFHTALTHESAERKALAYLGLALCQHRLGEPRAAISTLKELSRYKDEYETDQAKKKTTSNTIEIGLVAIGSVAMVAIIGPLGILVPHDKNARTMST